MNVETSGTASDKAGSTRRPERSHRGAMRVAVVYALVAAAWVLLSDVIVERSLAGSSAFAFAQLVKGWGFVVVTALALYALIRGHLTTEDAQSEALAALGQFRASVIDDAAIWINALDDQARITLWNKTAEQISGYTREEVLGNASIWAWLYPDPKYRAEIVAKANTIVSEGREITGLETEIRCKSGEVKVIAWNSRPLIDARAAVTGSITIGRDVTERRRVVLALLERERQLATLMANLPGMAYRSPADRPWQMRFVSSGCLALTGHRPEALTNGAEVQYSALIHPDDHARLLAQVRQAIEAGEPFEFEYRIRRKDGEVLWVWEQGCVVSIDGEPSLEGIVIDINERKRMEGELAFLAARDALTGLYNRREFLLHFGEEVQRAARYDRPLSLLLIDVDHFKSVNDRSGHQIGDEVLKRIGGVLQLEIRKVDYAARYGGEEFVVVLPEMDAAAALDTAERLRGLLAAVSMEDGEGRAFTITVSIGVAAFPADGATPEAMFEAADRAMYAAKNNGRNRVCRAS
ncbi:MAG: diguanylate cyclase [Rhodocyclales bacterium]|nr:diguanylate cyclase [Rhodocyclales bacterium]